MKTTKYCARADARFVPLIQAACPKPPYVCKHSRRIIVRILEEEVDSKGRIQFVESGPALALIEGEGRSQPGGVLLEALRGHQGEG